ncbi:BREX system ATP-binding domain-containing protein [Siccirubricoccus deserti]
MPRSRAACHGALPPTGLGWQARALYAEAVRNLATRAKPEGGALASVLERFVADLIKDARSGPCPSARCWRSGWPISRRAWAASPARRGGTCGRSLHASRTTRPCGKNSNPLRWRCRTGSSYGATWRRR